MRRLEPVARPATSGRPRFVGRGSSPGRAPKTAGIGYLVLVSLVGRAIYHIGRGRKYGRSHLQFSRFPIFLGESLKARFESTRSIRSPGPIWSETAWVPDSSVPGQQGTSFDISFSVPANALATRLTSELPRFFWDLEVEAATPGVDFCAVFLLPVYARSARQRP